MQMFVMGTNRRTFAAADGGVVADADDAIDDDAAAVVVADDDVNDDCYCSDLQKISHLNSRCYLSLIAVGCCCDHPVYEGDSKSRSSTENAKFSFVFYSELEQEFRFNLLTEKYE